MTPSAWSASASLGGDVTERRCEMKLKAYLTQNVTAPKKAKTTVKCPLWMPADAWKAILAKSSQVIVEVDRPKVNKAVAFMAQLGYRVEQSSARTSWATGGGRIALVFARNVA
jgi:hypothetical protein